MNGAERRGTMATLTTPDGRTLYPYNYACISFTAVFGGEERTGFCFALHQDAGAVAAELGKRGAHCLVGRTAIIESDDEVGFPDFRAWVNAMDNCDTASRIGARIVVLRAKG